MTTSELFKMPPDTAGVDRWLCSGQLVERWNGNGFHTPAHSAVTISVSSLLSRWCGEFGRGTFRAFGYRCPYLLERDPDTVVSFDASVVTATAVKAVRPDSTHIEAIPLLAVEVMELDEDEEILQRMVDETLRCGVRSMWVIDPFEPLVVWHRPDAKPVYVNGGMELNAGPHLPGFSCPVAEIFE